MQTGPGAASFGLEAQLHPQLQVTCVERAAGLSKSRIPNAVVELTFSARQLEIGVIQDIETFRSELELSSLCDLEVLE